MLLSSVTAAVVLVAGSKDKPVAIPAMTLVIRFDRFSLSSADMAWPAPCSSNAASTELAPAPIAPDAQLAFAAAAPAQPTTPCKAARAKSALVPSPKPSASSLTFEALSACRKLTVAACTKTPTLPVTFPAAAAVNALRTLLYAPACPHSFSSFSARAAAKVRSSDDRLLSVERRFRASISFARFSKNCPACRCASDAISNPASIFSLSKIGFSAFKVSEVSRFNAAIVSAAVIPVRCCCAASSRITTVPPLMALCVVELLLPLAPTTMGVPMPKPPLPGATDEPCSLLAPPATWPPLVVPRPASAPLPPPKPKPPPMDTWPPLYLARFLMSAVMSLMYSI